MRVILVFIASLFTAGLPLVQAPPGANVALAALAEEFAARSGPGFWGDTEGPIVRDRLALLSESVAREDARWAAGLVTRLDAIPVNELDHEGWLTWSLLRWEGEMGSGRGDFFGLETPIAPDSSPLRTITSGFAAARLTSKDDRRRYLDGLDQLPVLAARIEAKLRGQAAGGIVLPRAQVDAVVVFIRSFAAAGDTGPFAVPAARLADVESGVRDDFANSVNGAIGEVVAPAFERLAAYVGGAYREKAPESVGLGQYPGGERYYRHLVRLHTGMDLSPQQIHEIGLAEVVRLAQALDAARRESGFQGTLAEFRTFLKTDSRFLPASPEQIGETLMAAAGWRPRWSR